MTKEQEDELLDDPKPAQSYAAAHNIAITALKAAYSRGHQCDLGDKCPGCMAGYALEAITGRKWTQDECEEQ